jgi:TRAP transporter TAXI family solute receptor
MSWLAPRVIADGTAGRPGPKSRRRARRALLPSLLLPIWLLSGPHAAAESASQTTRFFHIAAGPVDGSSFTVAGFLATALSAPPGARPCDRGGSCGVPGLIAVVDAVATSADALAMLTANRADAALLSADAIHGDQVRSIATLFYREFHLVVLATSDIRQSSDIKGNSVALAGRTAESGRLARLLGERAAFIRKGKRDTVVEMENALTALAEGTVATLLAVGTAPMPELAEFARTTPIRLIGVTAAMLGNRAGPDYAQCTIPDGTYKGVGETETLCMPTALIVRADAPDELVYAVTASLWNEGTVRLLATGGPGARDIKPAKALSNLAAPLHSSAARYYQETGMQEPVKGD